MHRYFGEIYAYDLFNNISILVTLFSSIFLVKAKKQSLGLWSRRAVFNKQKSSEKKAKKLETFLAFLEVFLLAVMFALCAVFTAPFGELVGTGYNFFGCFYGFFIIGPLFSLAIMANPMEQIDLIAPLLSIRLFFIRVACYCDGCCWGIPWEYGPYNHSPYHPGNQVPVQAIEAIFVVGIFFFLLWYRKKAKKGTMYPMFIILYSSLRFFNEFFTDDYPNVLGPFNMYQILCVITVIIGIVFYFIAVKYGDRMFKFIDNKHKELDKQINTYEKNKRAVKRH